MPNILPPKLQRLDKVRADFFVDGFKQLLAQKGLRLLWEQRQPCPCYVSTNEYNFDLNAINDIDDEVGTNPTCPVCRGGGLVKHSSQEIRGIVSGVNSDYDSNDFGTVILPEVLITLLPEHLPSFGDRFTLLDSAMIRQEVLDFEDAVPQGATFELSLNYPGVVRTLELDPDNVEKTILSIYYTDESGNTVGELPETDGLNNTLWSYDAVNNKIIFSGVNAGVDRPFDTSKISISYYSNPTFSIFGQPFAIRDTFLRKKGVEVATPMPIQAYAKLEKK